MKEKMILKTSETLEKMAGKLAGVAGCLTIWGETELPHQLKEELEKERLEKNH